MGEEDQFLTLNEVCDLLRVHSATILRWRQAGRLKALKTPGGQLRFRKSDVRKVLEEEAVPA